MLVFKPLSARWSVPVWAGVMLVSGWSTVGSFAQADDTPGEAEAVEPVGPIDDVAPADDELQAETEDDSQAQADDDRAQAALESELASARRFEAEVTALLQPDGQLDTTQGDDALARLASLSTRCGILANSAMHDEVRLLLLGYQARTLAALASLQPDDPQEPGRLKQLRDVADQIGALDLPGSQAAADYWALLATLAKHAQSKETPTQVQALTEWLLETYIDEHADDEHAAEFIVDTRLSLAQLMDQRGAQRQVARQLEKIGELPADSPRLAEFNRLRDSAARLGTPIKIDSLSTQLELWRSTDHVGKPVLIHLYADSVDPSVRMIDAISRRIVEGSLSGTAIVSLRVGEPVASTDAPPWPTLPVQLEPDGVIDQLGANALPTLAWLDEEGRLASIGNTAAVLDQLASIRPKEADEPAVDETDEAGVDETPDEDGQAEPDEVDASDAPEPTKADEGAATEDPTNEDAPAESDTP